jgi:adenosylcobinamide kinase/adenosylcobinamide-phosphate guanylyltransferase
MAVLMTGGARSGKSAFAEQYASRSGMSGIYIATSQLYDNEMMERAELHRQQRIASGFPWETVEEPYRLAELLNRYRAAFASLGETPPVLLIDCLTLWLTNRLLAAESGDGSLGSIRPDQRAQASDGGAGNIGGTLEQTVEELVAAVADYPYPLILVTNEVGSGIVPEFPLGRSFRDAAGRLNRRMADVCSRVFLVTAGIPVDLKAAAFRWEDL